MARDPRAETVRLFLFLVSLALRNIRQRPPNTDLIRPLLRGLDRRIRIIEQYPHEWDVTWRDVCDLRLMADAIRGNVKDPMWKSADPSDHPR